MRMQDVFDDLRDTDRDVVDALEYIQANGADVDHHDLPVDPSTGKIVIGSVLFGIMYASVHRVVDYDEHRILCSCGEDFTHIHEFRRHRDA